MAHPSILDYLDATKGCASLDDLTVVTRHHFEGLGFGKWAYQAQLPTPLNKVPRTLLLHNFPKPWEQAYVQQNLATVDPVITHGTLQTRPFQWSHLIRGHDVTKPVADYLGQAADHGLVDGFGIPITTSTRRIAMVSFTAGGTPEHITRRFESRAPDLIALAFAFDSMARDLADAQRALANGTVLSPREKECLLWSLQGKTAWEIAHIIGTTERTVIFHIENAKIKLNTTSKMHAVVKATIEGYISP